MNKKEKYINFIVDDLVKKTEIDYDNESVRFDFYTSKPSFFTPLPLYNLMSSGFATHVKTMYGARDSDVIVIWGSYRGRIHSKWK